MTDAMTSDQFPASRVLRLAFNVFRYGVAIFIAWLFLYILPLNIPLFNEPWAAGLLATLFYCFVCILIAGTISQFFIPAFKIDGAIIEIRDGLFFQRKRIVDRSHIRDVVVGMEWRLARWGMTINPFVYDVELYSEADAKHPIGYMNGFTRSDAEELKNLIGGF
jgi:hypothetical protein